MLRYEFNSMRDIIARVLKSEKWLVAPLLIPQPAPCVCCLDVDATVSVITEIKDNDYHTGRTPICEDCYMEMMTKLAEVKCRKNQKFHIS